MRMMIDMMMMATKARTAANTATWENRAATGKKKTWLQIQAGSTRVGCLECLLDMKLLFSRKLNRRISTEIPAFKTCLLF